MIRFILALSCVLLTIVSAEENCAISSSSKCMGYVSLKGIVSIAIKNVNSVLFSTRTQFDHASLSRLNELDSSLNTIWINRVNKLSYLINSGNNSICLKSSSEKNGETHYKALADIPNCYYHRYDNISTQVYKYSADASWWIVEIDRIMKSCRESDDSAECYSINLEGVNEVTLDFNRRAIVLQQLMEASLKEANECALNELNLVRRIFLVSRSIVVNCLENNVGLNIA